MTPYAAILAALDEGHTSKRAALREAYRLCDEAGEYRGHDDIGFAWQSMEQEGRPRKVGRSWQAVREVTR